MDHVQLSIPRNICCISVHFTIISTLLRNLAMDLSGSVMCLKYKSIKLLQFLISKKKSFTVLFVKVLLQKCEILQLKSLHQTKLGCWE